MSDAKEMVMVVMFAGCDDVMSDHLMLIELCWC